MSTPSKKVRIGFTLKFAIDVDRSVYDEGQSNEEIKALEERMAAADDSLIMDVLADQGFDTIEIDVTDKEGA